MTHDGGNTDSHVLRFATRKTPTLPRNPVHFVCGTRDDSAIARLQEPVYGGTGKIDLAKFDEPGQSQSFGACSLLLVSGDPGWDS